MVFFLIIVGIVLLFLGAEALVKGSASFALRMGLTPLAVGLVIVGYGTSLPELVVSIDASLAGRGEIAIGNVIGSNICNIGLILGVSALLRPLQVHRQVVVHDLPIMILVSVLMVLLLMNGVLSREKGLLFLAGLLLYTVWSLYYSRQQANGAFTEELPAVTRNLFWDLVYIFFGFVALWIGARSFLSGSVSLAQILGMSDAVIGLTVVALGTSLPELATALVATWRSQRDIAVGNVIGSSIFNILSVVGFAGTIRPFAISGVDAIDYGVMLLYALLLWPLMRSRHRVGRFEGGLLFGGYAVYIAYLVVSNRPY